MLCSGELHQTSFPVVTYPPTPTPRQVQAPWCPDCTGQQQHHQAVRCRAARSPSRSPQLQLSCKTCSHWRRPVCITWLKRPRTILKSLSKQRYSRGQCTGWRQRGTRACRWRVRGKSSGAYRCRGSAVPCRYSAPLPSVALCKRGRWSRSVRSDWDESVPRMRQSCSEPVSPTGDHSNFCVSVCSAICGGMILRSHSHGAGWWFHTMTAAWRSFLKDETQSRESLESDKAQWCYIQL